MSQISQVVITFVIFRYKWYQKKYLKEKQALGADIYGKINHFYTFLIYIYLGTLQEVNILLLNLKFPVALVQ